MPNQSGKIILVLILILLLLGAFVYFFLPTLKRKQPTGQLINNFPQSLMSSQKAGISTEATTDYSSKDLKISFRYPTTWFIDEKHYSILLTSYSTKIGKNQKPTKNQIQMDIDDYGGGCHKTIDENLKDPACGEGGPKIKPNEIVSKETEDLNGIKFHKYLIKYPNGTEHKFYFLEKGDRILQIDKKPDPSMFEKEFKNIVKSIQFN